MFSTEFWQYTALFSGIAILLATKAYIIRRKVNNQLEQYTHPQHFLNQAKKKISTPQQAVETLKVYLFSDKVDKYRLRNIAILTAVLKDFNFKPALNKQINVFLKKINGDKNQMKYVQYIKQSTIQWT